METLPSSDSQVVELFISARRLKDGEGYCTSDPIVKVFLEENGVWNLVGKTEQKFDELSPNFDNCISTYLIFHIKQPIKFEVVDMDKREKETLVATVQTELGKIAGTKNQTAVLELRAPNGKSSGKLIVRLDKPGDNMSSMLTFRWSGSRLKNMDGGWYDQSDAYLKFYRLKEEGGKFLTHQTEYVPDNPNPNWNEFKINMAKFCYGDKDAKLMVEVWDWDEYKAHQIIGKVFFTLRDLETTKEFKILNGGGRCEGILELRHFESYVSPTFFDFIRGGLSLAFILGIDFTSSNGNPQEKDSYHYIDPKSGLNQYQEAISKVSEIILDYDSDKLLPAFGFGGVPHFPNLNSKRIDLCFPLNGDPKNPDVKDLEGVMEAYSLALKSVELSGPTLFAPVLQRAMDIAKQSKDKNIYSCLLIVTDGVMHDMEKTIDLICEAAYLPLSVIIVGIGDENFDEMIQLDADVNPLRNSRGQICVRDLVQFVVYRKYENKSFLARDVLEELPRQILDYMKIMDKDPNKGTVVDIKNMLL